MRKLILALMLSVLLLGFGTAQAATSAIDNVPGGAGVAYWQANAAGFYTLLSIQNVADNSDPTVPPLTIGRAAIAVHLSFYDRDSNHKADMTVPLSGRDEWGCAITGNGATVTITPQLGLAFAGYAPPFSWSFSLAGIGASGLQHGYVTAAITRVDNVQTANFRVALPNGALTPVGLNGNSNSNPWDDPDMANQRVVLPDFLIMRSAILSPASALGFNGDMLQGFLNIPAIQESLVGDFTDSVAINLPCAAAAVDWDNDLFVDGVVTLQDHNGIDIQAPELYITDNFTAPVGGLIGRVIVDNCAVVGRAGRHRALGAAEEPGTNNGIYWGRYNVSGTGFTDSTLLMVAPANSASIYNPISAIADPRDFVVIILDDNENSVSTGITPPEVSLSPLTSATNLPLPGDFSIDHSNFTSGELRVQILAPIFGYIQTTIAGTMQDLYPLVKNRVNVNVVNIGVADPAAGSDVRIIGY